MSSAVAVRIKVDEDLPQDVARLMREAGYAASTVLEQGLGGTGDARLWEIAQQQQQCLLTADNGFADAHTFPPGTHSGVVLFRLPRETRTGYIHLARSLLEGFDLGSAPGAIVVVTPEAIRVHRGGSA